MTATDLCDADYMALTQRLYETIEDIGDAIERLGKLHRLLQKADEEGLDLAHALELADEILGIE